MGLIINHGNFSGLVRDTEPYELGEVGSAFLTRPRLADHLTDAATVQRRADDAFAGILDGELLIEITEQLDFDNIADGHARIVSQHQIGKAVALIRAAPLA